MEQKLLFVASSQSHIQHFHLPYLRQLQTDGWIIDAACGDCCEQIAYTRRTVRLPLKKQMFSIRNIYAAMILWQLIHKEQYAAVLVHTSLAAFFTRLSVKWMKSRPKIINMVHGYLFDDQTPFVKRQLLLAAERVTATETDLLITMNQYDYALAKHFQLGRQIAFIPGIGIDYSRLDSQRTGYPEQLRQELGIPQDAVLLLYAAEFSRRKSQNVLLRVMANLPKHIFLVLPGGTGRTQAACQRLAEKLQIQDRVCFPGYISDIGPWYEMADIVVSSSRSEGCPFHILEAMHFSLPVVASRVKGTMDLLQDGKTGLLCPYGDVATYVSQIQNLLNSPALCQSLGKAAKNSAAQYDQKQVFPQVMALYNNILPQLESKKDSVS